jgi:hypothetical protein
MGNMELPVVVAGGTQGVVGSECGGGSVLSVSQRERLLALQAEIESGRYGIRAEALADAMLRRAAMARVAWLKKIA